MNADGKKMDTKHNTNQHYIKREYISFDKRHSRLHHFKYVDLQSSSQTDNAFSSDENTENVYPSFGYF